MGCLRAYGRGIIKRFQHPDVDHLEPTFQDLDLSLPGREADSRSEIGRKRGGCTGAQASASSFRQTGLST